MDDFNSLIEDLRPTDLLSLYHERLAEAIIDRERQEALRLAEAARKLREEGQRANLGG